MNGHNKCYMVLFGNDHHHPELHYNACRDKFEHLPDARRFAAKYSNAHIFCVKLFKDSGDIEYISEVR